MHGKFKGITRNSGDPYEAKATILLNYLCLTMNHATRFKERKASPEDAFSSYYIKSSFLFHITTWCLSCLYACTKLLKFN